MWLSVFCQRQFENGRLLIGHKPNLASPLMRVPDQMRFDLGAYTACLQLFQHCLMDYYRAMLADTVMILPGSVPHARSCKFQRPKVVFCSLALLSSKSEILRASPKCCGHHPSKFHTSTACERALSFALCLVTARSGICWLGVVHSPTIEWCLCKVIYCNDSSRALQYFAGDFKPAIPNLCHRCRLIDIAESFTKSPISKQGNKERNRERESEILYFATDATDATAPFFSRSSFHPLLLFGFFLASLILRASWPSS